MGAVKALLRDGHVGREFLTDRGPIGVAGVDGLGAAVGLDTGKEQVAALALNRSLQSERPGIGGDLIGASLAAEFIGHADGCWSCGFAGRRSAWSREQEFPAR